jgi:hypothetical protein
MPDATFYSMTKLSRTFVVLVLAVYLAGGFAPLNLASISDAFLVSWFVVTLPVSRIAAPTDEKQLPFPFLRSLASRAPPAS